MIASGIHSTISASSENVNRLGQLFEHLPRVFAWKPNAAFLAQVGGINSSELASLFGSRLKQLLATAPQARWIQDHSRLLSIPSTQRILESPEAYFRLVWTSRLSSEDPFWRSSINAERVLAGCQSIKESCWSALGDFQFGNDGSKSRSKPTIFRAPCLGPGIPIDFVSPYAKYVNSIGNLEFSSYTEAETAAIVAKLRDAFDRMCFACPEATMLINRFAKVIVVRKNIFRSNRFGSSSTPSHVGRILLQNAHNADCELLANALLHESMHALLYVFERNLSFVRPGSGDAVTVRSPWTGNELSLRTYIHACFVWFGLAHFWVAACKSKHFSRAASLQMLENAMRGFEANPALELHSHAEVLPMNLLTLAESLRSELGTVGDH